MLHMQLSCLFSLFQSVQVPWMFLNFLTLNMLKITGNLFYTMILNLSLVVLFSSWLNLSCSTRKNIIELILCSHCFIHVTHDFNVSHYWWSLKIKWYLPVSSNIKLLISHLQLRNILRRDNLTCKYLTNNQTFKYLLI